MTPSTLCVKSFPKLLTMTFAGVSRVSFGFKPDRVLSLCCVKTLF